MIEMRWKMVKATRGCEERTFCCLRFRESGQEWQDVIGENGERFVIEARMFINKKETDSSESEE